MSNEIMQETTPLVECSAFHRGMSVLEVIIVAVLLIGFICYMLFRPYKEAEHLSTKAKALAQK